MNKQITFLKIALASLAFGGGAFGQHEQHQQHQHSMDPAKPAAANESDSRSTQYLLGLSSGTSVNPASWAMPMLMQTTGGWNLMWMGQAFIVNTQQSGPRGDDGFYSTNWGMLAATHRLGRGSLMLRGMASLEPLTVSNRRYPLLFQSGEAAYGKSIVDGQHPHDLVMELSVHYARPVHDKTIVHLYYAPVGDVALGPVAYPHRASAMEIPQAALGHHWQDSTHIANNVFTAGVQYGKVRLEASGFRGREPNENRWNIDMGAMDSWASRLTWQPGPNWVAQVSAGRLRQPEELHPGDVVRSTASLQYTRPVPGTQGWSTSFVWGQNYKTDGQYRTNSILAETVVPIRRKNRLTGRFEWSQRDELFENNHDVEHELFEKTGKRAFGVAAFTAGYTRELASVHAVHMAAGFNVSAYAIASELRPYYGSTPKAASIFLRFRLDPSESH